MDYYLNNKPGIDEYNVYHNSKLKSQLIQNNNNNDLLRNNSLLKEKMMAKKYITSKGSSNKLIEDSTSQYIMEKSSDLFANKLRKKQAKKAVYNTNYKDNSENLLLNRNYNKYIMNNSGLGNNNYINMSNNLSMNMNNNMHNISNSNFAYNHNLLNYYNNNSLEPNDFLNNNNFSNTKYNNNKIFMKKLNYKNYNDEFENYLEPENSYNNLNNNNGINNNGIDLMGNNFNKNKYITGYKKVSDNKLVKNYLHMNNFKKVNEKLILKNKIYNAHQRMKSNEDPQNKMKKIYNLKFAKERPKYILKYNNNISNNINNNSEINFINKKKNNYLNDSELNELGLSSEISKINYNLNKTAKINFNNNINNINVDNNKEIQLNNLINSIEGYINHKNEIKKTNMLNTNNMNMNTQQIVKNNKNIIKKINNNRFYSLKSKKIENNNMQNMQMVQNKSENKMRLKKVLNSNIRQKLKEQSEISNEIGGTSSINIKTTFFSSFNNNNNNNSNNINNINNNMNKIKNNNNDNNNISVSKSNNFNIAINENKNTAENNFKNLVIKEYNAKEKNKDKIKNKYNSTNNSFNNKIYQKKISTQKEYLTANNSIPNIKLQNVKKTEIDVNKLNKNNSNMNVLSSENNKNLPVNTEEIKTIKEKKETIITQKENKEEKKENITIKEIESKKEEKKINKNDNNKNNIVVNNSYKTNEFENRNIAEFPVNENIIKNKVEEHNNLYINNNNITELNEKKKDENNNKEIKEKEKIEKENKQKEEIKQVEIKDMFKSIHSTDTLTNKEKNLVQLNSNIVKKEEIKNKINENKKIEIEIDINIDNKKNENNIINEIKEKNKDNLNDNNIIKNEKINDNKEIKLEPKKEKEKEKIDLNFLEKNILGEKKEEPIDINNNIITEKKLDKDDIKLLEDKEEEKNIINIDDNKKIKEDTKKENKITAINEELIIEPSLDSTKTKNKRELHKINEKLMNLYKQDMLCIPSQYKNAKSTLKSNLMGSTYTKDSNFYKGIQEKLSEEIKEYYKQNKSYPKSSINYYLYGRQIGHGAFGQVNLALHIASGRLVAIKIFAKKNLRNTRAKEKIMTEIETLSNFHHPFINQILDNFETSTHIFIVMEYVCGDLLGFIRKRSKLSESVSKIIFKQLIEGLKYIHKKHFVHRDIKLDNILIDLTNTIKICDFGVSKHFDDKNEIMFDHCGTPAYIAPEIFEHTGYKGPACDIWSAGVTLYYMLAGEQPFKAGSISELEKIIKAGDFKEIEGVSKEANNLLSKILQVNPKARLSLDEILNHKWLDKVDLSQRQKLSLFTEAEKILMSKYDVNYLHSDKNELIENFTLKNIEDNANNKNKNNGNTKSIIFAPYNTFIDEFDSEDKNNTTKSKRLIKKSFSEDEFYKEIEIKNDICKFGLKAQQLNIQYELSNNGDFDNGLIKTEKQEDFQKENEIIEKMFEVKKGKKSKHKEKYTDEYDVINVRKDILAKIEKEIGYKSDYIVKCIKKNEINYATATYYLLEKDEQFN